MFHFRASQFVPARGGNAATRSCVSERRLFRERQVPLTMLVIIMVIMPRERGRIVVNGAVEADNQTKLL